MGTLNFMSAKVARWAVKRQDALLDAEKVLKELVELKRVKNRIEAGKATAADKQFYNKRKNPTWMRAEKAVKELKATERRNWNKDAV